VPAGDAGAVGAVLAVNGGSSSLKTALFDGSLQLLARVSVPRLADGVLHADIGGARTTSRPAGDPLVGVLAALREAGAPEPGVVVHRFVHGGLLDGPRRLDEGVLAELGRLADWAPLHQRQALANVATMRRLLPTAEQVGCFDTLFGLGMAEEAARLPVPDELWRAGIRRYGFHGLSYQGVVETMGEQRLGRAVLAHLGNGSSLAAVAGGRCVESSMGVTPEGGVPSGTRTGDLDPGLLLYLLDTGWTVERLRTLVQRQGGLTGLSGGTSDMAELLGRTDQPARLAVAVYCRRVAMQVGAYAVALGGLDSLVFTGGIGEHAAPVREAVCAGLVHLGVELDTERNTDEATPAGVPRVISRGSVEVSVVSADEEATMAAQATRSLASVPG